jgi:predicted transcriptional regulator
MTDTHSGVQTTSLFAYRNEILPTLGERQKAVYDELAQHQNMTNSEIAASLHSPINTITPRVYELREAGVVVEACRRECRVTGRRVIAWAAKQTALGL